MKSKIKVSIIIPVYNTALYLSKCLDSLLNQTLTDIEIICINDGSTDNSLNILNLYAKKDSRIKVVNQCNQGQSVARNAGMEIAQGEYIGFLDSDDWADENMFEHLFNNAKVFDSDMAMCSIFVYDDTTGNLSANDPYMTLNLFPKEYFNKVFCYKDCLDFIFRICVTPWNKIYRREWITNNNLKFCQGVNFEDTIFSVISLLKAEKISLINEPLIFYRKLSKTSYSQSNQQQDYKKLDFFIIFEKIEKILRDNNVYDLLRNYFDFHKKNSLIYWYEKIHNEKVKKKYYKKLVELYPDFRFNKLISIIKKVKLKNKIKKLLKNNKIIVWGAGTLVRSVLPKSSKNILGFVDINVNLQGKIIDTYRVFSVKDLKELNPNFVLAITQNYYKFGNLVKAKLKDYDLDIEVKELTI